MVSPTYNTNVTQSVKINSISPAKPNSDKKPIDKLKELKQEIDQQIEIQLNELTQFKSKMLEFTNGIFSEKIDDFSHSIWTDYLCKGYWFWNTTKKILIELKDKYKKLRQTNKDEELQVCIIDPQGEYTNLNDETSKAKVKKKLQYQSAERNLLIEYIDRAMRTFDRLATLKSKHETQQKHIENIKKFITQLIETLSQRYTLIDSEMRNTFEEIFQLGKF